MRTLICMILLILVLICPQYAFAQDFRLNIAIIRLDDGSTNAELWYNDEVIWRLTLMADGAAPVSSGSGVRTTVLIPDILDGCFLLKINNAN